MEDVGYEQLICQLCGHERAPRPASRRHTMACGQCGGREFRRRPMLALEEDELDLLVELAEFVELRSQVHLGVLEKLYAEQRFDVAA